MWFPRNCDRMVVLRLEASRIVINVDGLLKNRVQMEALLSSEQKLQEEMVTPDALRDTLLEQCVRLPSLEDRPPQMIWDYLADYMKFYAAVPRGSQPRG